MKPTFTRAAVVGSVLLATFASIAACGGARETQERTGALLPTGSLPRLSGPAGCAGDDAGPAVPLALPSRVELGAFRVRVGPEMALEVTHAEAPGRSLFSAPSATPLVSAARARLDVDEHQGSFDIDERLTQRCTEARLHEARLAGHTLLLEGGFSGGGAACESLRWKLQLCEVASGHLGFHLSTNDPSFNHLALSARSEADERIYGMGEQFPRESLNLKGRRIPVLSQEGGIGRGHPVITPAVNAASRGSGGSENSTYYAAAHYLTSRLRSLMLENPEYAVFDFRADDAVTLQLFAPEMTGRILYGHSPLSLIERFTEYAGRMPPLPSWVHEGAIVALARPLDESRTLLHRLRGQGAEVAAVWNQTWSGKVDTWFGEQVLWNWAQNPGYHPGWQDFVGELEQQGIRTLCYVNPMLVDPPEKAGAVSRNLYREALERGYLVRDAKGAPYPLKVTAFEAGLLDLTHEGARGWMKDVLRDELLDGARCAGWMVDFAEALPFDAKLHSGTDAAAYHNVYPVEWMRLNREAIEEAGRLGEVLLFNRSGAARTPAYSLLLWEGDQLVTWDAHDGMGSALRGLLNGGFSGIALNHSDTGGYTSLSVRGLGYVREPELLARWTEMNAFTAVLRTHEGNQPGSNAQVYSDEKTLAHFARFTKVYKALGFYRRQLEKEATERGWPLVRHLWMQYPEDLRAQHVDDAFMLGSELLVAPVTKKCGKSPACTASDEKTLYLPEGEWVHLWSGRVHRGPTDLTVQAPLGHPAVFYRHGSTIAGPFLSGLRASGIHVPDAREH